MNLSSNLRVAVLMTAVTTHLFGVVYPLPMTAVAPGPAEADLRALLAAHVEGRQLVFPASRASTCSSSTSRSRSGGR